MNITIGTTIDCRDGNKYTILKCLNSGGFGSVYEAENVITKERVAIKTLKSEFANEKQLQSFKNEIEMARHIESPYAVKYFFTNDGEYIDNLPPFIIMELSADGNLSELIESRNGTLFTNDELVHYFMQLLYGMRDINGSILHRDIKPENILLFDNCIKIADFGISKCIGDETRTQSFKGWGSARYIPPEIWNNGSYTIQGDMYALGIVLYQLATLKYPYEVKSDYSDAHRFETYKPISEYNPYANVEIVSIIDRMLAKVPINRFDSWDDIIKVLQNNSHQTCNEQVISAISKKIRIDEEKTKKDNEQSRIQETRKELIKNNAIQIKTQIIKPIIEFANQFNSGYAGNDKMYIANIEGPFEKKYNEFSVLLGEDKILEIEIDTIYPNSYLKDILKEDLSIENLLINPNNHFTPSCENKEVMAWGRIIGKLFGINIMLLRNNETGYGDWYQFIGKNSGLGTQKRIPEPFALEFKELPREITCLHVLHIYNYELKPCNDRDLEKIVSECI